MLRPTARIIALTLALALLAPSSTGASDGCPEARRDLLLAWEISGHELTPEVAQAIKDRLDSCAAATSAPPTQSSTCTPSSCAGLRIPVAKECGFTSVTSASHPKALITAWYQVSGVHQPEPDEGGATATFAPGTGETTYGVDGVKWGLDASSTGVATIWLHGIPIPAEGTAVAGCTAIGVPELCWARASGKVIVEEIGGIVVESSFTKC